MMEILKAGAVGLGIPLDRQQLEQFEIYYREIITWNRKINLTRITGPEEAQNKHFLDSLTIVLAVPALAEKNLKVIDIGTGAGLPGIPLKIAFPGTELALLEATAKKAAFLKEVVKKLEMQDTKVIAERAEVTAHNGQFREQFDIALARAVTALPSLAELMIPFCKLGGMCVAMKKGDIDEEVTSAQRAIERLGGRLREVKPVELHDLQDNRRLVIIDKIRPTPMDYPRRSGVPVKRPLLT
jgi:16S rRNA (guanine527-N7)-methyltransferase